MGGRGDDPGRKGALASEIYRIGRRVSRLPILGSLVPARLRAAVQRRLLDRAINQMPDRRYMEEVLLPSVAALGPRLLLDVEVRAYTRGHGSRLPDGCEYWTLDADPEAAGFGSPGRHVVAEAQYLGRHFAPGSFDVVLLNGLLGFGIDRLEEQERAIAAARATLRPGGWLLVGWDRAADGSPIVMRDPGPGVARVVDPLESDVIRSGFDHVGPPGLPARIDFAECSHVYDWFRARSNLLA